MKTRTAEIRDTSLLAAAAVLGVLLTPLVSLIGLPIAAAGVGALAYRGKALAAALAAALGVIAVVVVQPADVVFAAPAITAVLLAVVLLPRRDYQLVGALLVSVLGLAGAGHDALLIRAQNTTAAALISSWRTETLAQASKMAGSGPDAIAQLKQIMDVMISLIPALYFFTGLATGVAVIVAIAWAARKSDRTVKVPQLSRVDLTPHVLWPFVVGLLLLAAGHSGVSNAALLGVVGLNLVMCVRMLFLIQGMGVAAGTLDRIGVGLGGRILALAAFAALDAFTFGGSFVGLMDFWVNFRHLPRDGVTPTQAVSAS